MNEQYVSGRPGQVKYDSVSFPMLEGEEKLCHALLDEFLICYMLWIAKHKSYGPGNIAEFAERGVVIRMTDKLKRLLRLVVQGKPNPLQDESIMDSYHDLCNYALMACLVRNGQWPGCEWEESGIVSRIAGRLYNLKKKVWR